MGPGLERAPETLKGGNHTPKIDSESSRIRKTCIDKSELNVLVESNFYVPYYKRHRGNLDKTMFILKNAMVCDGTAVEVSIRNISRRAFRNVGVKRH